jgi:hypothetical protein
MIVMNVLVMKGKVAASGVGKIGRDVIHVMSMTSCTEAAYGMVPERCMVLMCSVAARAVRPAWRVALALACCLPSQPVPSSARKLRCGVFYDCRCKHHAAQFI